MNAARGRARRLYPKSKGFENAYMRGFRAGLRGAPRTSCPYRADSNKTWRTAWRLAWLRGYDSVTGPAPD